KQKGFLTYDEVNDALPSDIVSLDQLDDIMMMFGAMDIEVVDSAKAARLPSEVARPAAVVEDDDDGGGGDAIDLSPGPVGRTEDPVRLYLREMGRVALLTREGEIALAKRIEEGKNQVTAAILSTNLALERFRELREQLRRGESSIKEVVDVNEEEFTEEKEEELQSQVIKLWTNGRRPSPEEVQNLIYVSFRDPGTGTVNGPVGDLHLKAAKKFQSPKAQQIWVAQQEVKLAEQRANAKADEIKRVMTI